MDAMIRTALILMSCLAIAYGATLAMVFKEDKISYDRLLITRQVASDQRGTELGQWTAFDAAIESKTLWRSVGRKLFAIVAILGVTVGAWATYFAIRSAFRGWPNRASTYGCHQVK